MTVQEILNSSNTKTKKAYLLFDLGHTRSQVAEWVTNGNYGFAHNIWKKWDAVRTGTALDQPISIAPFEFEFNRTFGIELEICGPNRDRLINCFAAQGLTLASQNYNHTTPTTWKIVSDSSIRGTEGNEIVSPVLQGTNGLDQLRRATIALGKAGAKVNTSCGFHVHFGAQDLSIDNFKTLAKNHINLEAAFDALVPESRRANKNTYCKSLVTDGRSKSDVIAKINACNTISEMTRLFHSRYVKLNFQSFVRQGTVEVRHHSGTVTYSKIKNWVLICARLVEASKQNRIVNNLNEILNEALTEYVQDRAIDLAA